MWLFLFVSFLIFGCHKASIEYPSVPPVTVTPTPFPEGQNYTQKLLTGGQTLRKRVALARFGDNRTIEESPFGQKSQVDILGPGISIHQEEVLPEGKEPSSSFTFKLMDALARTKKFVLIERKDINSILRELTFGQTKWVDKEKSAKAGKILGAQIIVTGYLERNHELSTRDEHPLTLFLRMYDVETSRVAGTARALGATEQQVIDRAVSEILITMDKIPWIGKIASISGDRYYLNAGGQDHIKVGDTFSLFSLGRPIHDPDTKETIGYEEEPAGKAEVVAVSEKVATLKLTEKLRPIRVGDKVQPLEGE